MDITILFSMVPALASLFAVIYGMIHINKSNGTFHSFVVFGFFGFAIGNIYINLLEFVGEDGMVFSLGSLGIVSGFLSIAFACFSLEKVDGCDVENIKKYKLISLCVPAVFVSLWLLMLFCEVGFEEMIIATLLLFSSMPCAYRCCTLIIAPYPKNSFVRCMRPFFIATLVCSLCTMLGEVTWAFQYESWIVAFSLVAMNTMALGYIVMPILLEGGYKKWIQM